MGIYFFITMCCILTFFICIAVCFANKNYKVIQVIERGMEIAYKWLYYMIMFVCALLYTCIALQLNEMVSIFSATISAICLIIFVWLANFLYETILGQNSINRFEKSFSIMTAYIGVVIAGIILARTNSQRAFLEVSSIAISTIIGSFIPLITFVEITSWKDVVCKLKILFKNIHKNIKLIIVYLLFVTSAVWICFEGKYAIVSQIGYAILLSGLILAVFFIVYLVVKKRKK